MGFIFLSLVELAIVGQMERHVFRRTKKLAEKRHPYQKVCKDSVYGSIEKTIKAVEAAPIFCHSTLRAEEPPYPKRRKTCVVERPTLDENSLHTPGSVYTSSTDAHLDDIPRSFQWSGEAVDRIFRVCIPLCFSCFNCFFWLYYTSRSKAEMERLLENGNLTGSYTPE
ncbi:unnamed protein product [Enterobius vermicularis]|uniref:G_PROTEIN_RECEP_F1_2 domain-containing protein n=1 Tax=Enterobius vermicularis TaxID=51028 RepID=A0A0N4V4S5_ENTVE|nr:unnamed protein product [Enterobius vermicularis]